MARGRAAAWLAALALAVPQTGLAGARVEFLYADASEGGATGGHVALRLDDRVYHYQRDADGLLTLARDTWRSFAFQYRVIENRNLFASEISVAEETAAQLHAHFERRYFAERAERKHLAALRDDVALLDALASPESAGFALRGAGFFASGRAASSPSERAAQAAITSLRRQLEETHGVGLFDARRRDARWALRSIADAASLGHSGSSLDAYPFSERYADAFAAERALDVLAEATPLRRDARRVLPGVLDAADRAALRERRRALETALGALIASPRPDWGFAFLLGTARLALTVESIERNRLVVLDVAPAAEERVPFAGPRAALAAHLAWRRERLVAARDAFFASPTDERALSTLEREAAEHAELASAVRAGTLPRRLAETLVPEGHALVSPLPAPGLDAATGAALRERAVQRLATAEASLRRVSDYDLIEHNCATELFAQIESAVDEGTLPAVGAAPFAFVPFVADRAVNESWPGVRRRVLPSHLATVRAEEPGWLASLRESNTLTSTLYVPHAGDSIFLFFTDDVLLARPLFGALNVATGVAASGVGLLSAPVDRGALLGRGLRGVAASLPELAFFNVRKGTFPLALPARPAAASRPERAP